MIRRPGAWDDGVSERPQSESPPRLPLLAETIPALDGCLTLPPSQYLTTKKLEDARLVITFTLIDAPASPQHASLARTEPLLFTALDSAGNPLVTYALDVGKISGKHRGLIGGLLAETDAQRSRGDTTTTTLQLLKATLNHTSKIEDAWSTRLPNAHHQASAAPSPLMTLYIPSVRGYLKDPSKLGRIYQSRASEGPNAHAVVLELDPGRNQARFIFRGPSSKEVGAVIKPIVITVPGPAQGSLCVETAMRYLRIMSWNALEKLRDEGPQQFLRHLRQFKSEKHSVHIKNLPTHASFQVSATPAETQIVLASRPFRAKGNEEPLPARHIFKFPGNMENPSHPLHTLLADLATAVRTPDSEQQLENVIGRVVEVLRGCNRSSLTSHAPTLKGMFAPDTLKLLRSIPGISIQPVTPGEPENMRILDGTGMLEPVITNQLARAVAEVAKGISRIQVRPLDIARWRGFPEVFSCLTLDIYPDHSVHLRAENTFGATLQCFLSRASRFPKHFPGDLAELICKAFAQQVEGGSPVESSGLLLRVLTTLIKTDSERNFLCYRAGPPTAPR